MNLTAVTVVTILLYLATAALLGRRLARGAAAPGEAKLGYLTLGLGGVILHAALLYVAIFTLQGLNLGFFNAVSLITWLIALLILVAAITRPVENLAIFILPVAALALLLQVSLPSDRVLDAVATAQLKMHIMFSMLAYSLLGIAALQAILLAIQDRHLHNRQPGGFIRALPPLRLMETLLFQMIAGGFALLSLALLTGFLFLEDIFAQHLVHKTVLSMVAWFVFGILLWGRWQRGWRGRTAIRWTLGGFFALLLAYVGSKLVLELILRR